MSSHEKWKLPIFLEHHVPYPRNKFCSTPVLQPRFFTPWPQNQENQLPWPWSQESQVFHNLGLRSSPETAAENRILRDSLEIELLRQHLNVLGCGTFYCPGVELKALEQYGFFRKMKSCDHIAMKNFRKCNNTPSMIMTGVHNDPSSQSKRWRLNGG